MCAGAGGEWSDPGAGALSMVRKEGGEDPVLILKIINLYIQQLEKQAEKCQKTKSVELKGTGILRSYAGFGMGRGGSGQRP